MSLFISDAVWCFLAVCSNLVTSNCLSGIHWSYAPVDGTSFRSSLDQKPGLSDWFISLKGSYKVINWFALNTDIYPPHPTTLRSVFGELIGHALGWDLIIVYGRKVLKHVMEASPKDMKLCWFICFCVVLCGTSYMNNKYMIIDPGRNFNYRKADPMSPTDGFIVSVL